MDMIENKPHIGRRSARTYRALFAFLRRVYSYISSLTCVTPRCAVAMR